MPSPLSNDVEYTGICVFNGNEDKKTNGPVNYRPAKTTKSRFAKFLRLGNASIYHLSDEKKI